MRCTYAPPPLGQPTKLTPLPPALPTKPVQPIRYDHITNTGSLLDILA